MAVAAALVGSALVVSWGSDLEFLSVFPSNMGTSPSAGPALNGPREAA